MRRLLLAGLAACTTQNGTITLTMVTAPGSTVLDAAQALKVVITNPHQEFQATRDATGFDLSIDVDHAGASGAILIDAYDASGALVATGESPPFPIAAVDAAVAVYMAAPRSLAAAPVALPLGLTGLGVGALNYGVIFAGGTDDTGAVSGNVSIYNAYDHTLSAGLALTVPRTGIAVGVSQSGVVYLFGGTDGAGSATGTLTRFDTTVAPSGSYSDLSNHPELARTGQRMVAAGADEQLVTGTPVAVIAALGTSVTARSTPTSLPAAGDAQTTSDGVATAVFATDTGLVRFRDDVVDTIAATVPTRPVVTAMAPDSFAIVGDTTQLLAFDATTGTVTTGTLATARTGAAVAATDRYLLVAGGATAELFDVGAGQRGFAPVATIPMVVPRTGASAVALPNGQILIAGGVDTAGMPVATIELFTPDPTE